MEDFTFIALAPDHTQWAQAEFHGGITLRCVEGEASFALTGGDFTARVEGAAAAGWTTGVLRAGQRLLIRDGGASNWAVLGFAGAIECPQWLGSAATLALVGLGGGRLVAGDRLVIEARLPGEARPLPLPSVARGPIGSGPTRAAHCCCSPASSSAASRWSACGAC